MNFEVADIGLSAIRRVTDLWAAGKADSLIDYTSVARVEPITLIDADCLYHEDIGQVMQSMLSIFAGYYLQAVAISTTVGKIEVVKHLDKLNPKRNPLDSALNTAGTGEYAGGLMMATEAYQHRLPSFADTKRLALESQFLALEADHDNVPDHNIRIDNRRQRNDDIKTRIAERKERQDNAKFDFDVNNVYYERGQKDIDRADRRAELAQRAKEAKERFEHDKEKFGADKAFKNAQHELAKHGMRLQQERHDADMKRSEFGIGRDTLATLKELADLSVGKMLSVEITDGMHKASIPISVRLMASSLPTASLVHILSHESEDTSWKERWHGWRSGRLRLVQDLMLCQDLIDAHRKSLMADADGMYATILRRNRGNQLSAVLSGNPSVATASNLCVMSNTTAAELELKINGKLSDMKTRERMFKNTFMMIMGVLDKQWNRVTFYHRGIAGSTEVSLRDLKSSNKGNGPDVSDILRAYNLAQAPTL